VTEIILKSMIYTHNVAHKSPRRASSKGAYFPLIKSNEQATGKILTPATQKKTTDDTSSNEVTAMQSLGFIISRLISDINQPGIRKRKYNTIQ
jgi:hypothetical protein